MRTITSLLGNSQRLDGGAMFGNAPKAYWTRLAEPDSENRIALATRCLLLQENGKNTLFETGIGAFFAPDMARRFGVNETKHVLLDSLKSHGLEHTDIDTVVLSHLHFDHAGGLLSAFEPGAPSHLLFPNASFIVSEGAFARALSPHPRDRASYIPKLTDLLKESGRLRIVSRPDDLGEGFTLHFSEGHTPGQMLTEIQMPLGSVTFCGDLIPGTPWMHAPITMGYDRFPERLIDEKITLLNHAHKTGGRLFFTHDPTVAMARVGLDQKGRYFADAPQPCPIVVTQ